MLYGACMNDINNSIKTAKNFQYTICPSYIEGAADWYIYGLQHMFRSFDESRQELLIDKLINKEGLCPARLNLQTPRDIAITLFNRDEDNPASSPFFIKFKTVGANTAVKVDTDGAGKTYGWQQVAQLDNVKGLTDEAALKARGNLLVV